jgi:hypothetical protein
MEFLMDSREAISILGTVFNSSLNDTQELVFRQSWEGRTYSEIAEAFGYSADYIKDVGSELWSLLSQHFGEKVSKRNIRFTLMRIKQRAIPESDLHLNHSLAEFSPTSPKNINYQIQTQKSVEEQSLMSLSLEKSGSIQHSEYSLEERLSTFPKLKTQIEGLLNILENHGQQAVEIEKKIIQHLEQVVDAKSVSNTVSVTVPRNDLCTMC